MPSNIIIFDADYVSELTSSMRTACELMGEAVSSLKKARAHEGWTCKECKRIIADIDDLNTKLGRLDEGVNETTRVLGNNISNYADLEAKYESQASKMSEEFRENYGYTATVNNDFAASEENAGLGAGVGAAAAGSNIPTGRPQTPNSENNQRGSGGVNVRMPSGNMNINIGNNSGMPTGGTVNLPVTYIPDRTDLNVKSEKTAVEVADVTVNTVADTITNILGGRIKIVGADGTDITSQRLIDVYNAGKDIVDNSASIISNPQASHAQEHLAMAAGLVSLAGTAVTGLGMLGKAAAPSVDQAAKLDIKDIGKNAENLLPSLKDNSSAGELGNVLEAISTAGAVSSSGENSLSSSGISSSSGKSGKSFLVLLLEALLKKITGDEHSSSTSSSNSTSSSSVEEFLNSFVIYD